MIEEDLGSIGFMFDAEHERELREIHFEPNIDLKIRTIGDRPGHVQSGQYLWPAATAAGEYLVNNWSVIKSNHILELGAGCGLTGMVASRLPDVQTIVFTDYDPGTLQLIKENVQLNPIDTVKSHIQFLEWGKPLDSASKMPEFYPAAGFSLIIGTDLIYCKDVITPLFRSVKDLLHPERGVFVLAYSFALDPDSENAINQVCSTLHIRRIEQIPLNERERICKIDHFENIPTR